VRLALASTSPRRLALLARIGVVPIALPPRTVRRNAAYGELPRTYALRIASQSAGCTARAGRDRPRRRHDGPGRRRILGKPR